MQDYESIPNYPYTFPKIVDKTTVLVENSLSHLDYKCGIYIDIFLLTDVSNNFLIRQFQEIKRYIGYCKLKAYYFDFDSKFRRFISKIIQKFCNPQKIQKSLYKQYTREINKAKYVVDIGVFKNHALLCRKWFNNIQTLKFEDSSYSVCGEYDEYLKHYYGDYMQLPPEDKRVSEHDFAVIKFNKDEE